MRSVKLIVILLIIICSPSSFLYSQNTFPKDTSFSVASSYRKIKKEFPNARPVLPVHSSKILSLPDQVYRIRPNRKLRMDIFLPNDTPQSPRPAILMIHGGGWRSGNKSHLVPLAQQLAIDGYVTASVEQRLSIEAIYPAAVYDLKEAVRYLKHQSKTLGIDTTKIIVLGTSSGATMASLIAVTGNLKKFNDPNTVYPNESSEVQGLINMDGVVDFTTPAESAKDKDPDHPTSAGALFFGGTYQRIPEKWIEASPINYVNDHPVPTLYINSSLPRFHAGRDEFFKRLKQHDVPYEQHTIAPTPHPYWLFHPWFEQAHHYILSFMSTYFPIQ